MQARMHEEEEEEEEEEEGGMWKMREGRYGGNVGGVGDRLDVRRWEIFGGC